MLRLGAEKAMSNDKPLSFQEVLTDEYRGLRPDSGFERCAEAGTYLSDASGPETAQRALHLRGRD